MRTPERITRPELLCPAGDMEQLEAAILYGADAVYLSGKEFNLRAGSQGFDEHTLPKALKLAHNAGVHVYYCLNALPRQHDLRALETVLERLSSMSNQPDALIVADPGVISLARKRCPHMPLHLSTQANTTNALSAAFWKDQGVCRVNLARELDLTGIKAIARRCPDVELEVFVHGAMCLAVSGQCLLSAWLNARPANLGRCTHPCRFEYRAISLGVEEKTRPGSLLWEALREAPGYSTLWAPEDLCLIKYVRWFAKNGIRALKIEGRMKSGGYTAHVVDAYRTALDALGRKPSLAHKEYLAELANTASRPMGTGFFLPGGKRALYPMPACEQRKPVIAKILEKQKPGVWSVHVRSRWDARKPIEIMAPGMHRPVLAPDAYTLENHRGERRLELHPGLIATLYAENTFLMPGLYLRA